MKSTDNKTSYTASIMCTTSILSLYKLTNSPALLLIVYFVFICASSSMIVAARELGSQQRTQLKLETVGSPLANEPDHSLIRKETKEQDPINELQATNGKVGDKLNCSDPKSVNRTECSMSSDADGVNDYVRLIMNQMSENRGMLMRTLYVTLGVTGLVVAYFVIKSVWLRRKHTKSSMYGVAPVRGDHRDMEMKPLGDGNDDDDDDYTVFEVNGRKR